MENILRLYQELRGLFDENDLAVGFCQQIHGIIQEAIDRIPNEARIAMRPAGADTKSLLELYDFSGKNIVGVVNRRNLEGDFCGYPCFTVDSFSTKLCDYVIIYSFRFHKEIKEELETLHIPYVDIYDELEKRGIRLHVPCHFYESNIQIVVNYFYLRYLQSEAGPQREAALNELLQVAVECKDFMLISNIYQACGGENREFSLLKTVWEKSEQLLDRIQKKFRERKQKDVVCFWTDAVPYDMLQYLPETVKLSKQGTFFQRSYAHTPYTNSTTRAIFRSMLPIDDFPQNQEKIDSENSPLIQYLENEGYKVRVVSSSNSVGEEHLLEAEIGEELTCNIRWWEGIIDLLRSDEPCFYIFQFLEAHPPFYAPDLTEPVDPGTATRAQWEVQTRAAYGYLDQCLFLYHKLLGDKTQVFLSDHGYWLGPVQWGELKLHSYCFVVGENIPEITVTRFFPYKNFIKFVQWIVDPVHFMLDDVCEDEVIFQDTDFYNRRAINEFIKAGNAKSIIAYRGILNYEYKYVINAIGEEYFYRRRQDGSEELVPLEDSALRAELRRKAGTKFLDIYRYDKFRYTRKLYDFINQTKRGNPQ